MRRNLDAPRARARLRALPAATAALLATAACGGIERLDQVVPRERKVLLIGIDGLDYELCEGLIKAGQLKTLDELRRRGILVPLAGEQATLDPFSVGLDPAESWTTLATGVPPTPVGTSRAFHGVRDLTVPLAQSYERAPVTSAHRQAPVFWQVLSAAGVKSAIVHWPVTWPAEPLDGYLVSDRFFLEKFGLGWFGPAGRVDLPAFPRGAPGASEHLTWPPELAEPHAGTLAAALNGSLPPIFDAVRRMQAATADPPTLQRLKQYEQAIKSDFATKTSLAALLKADPGIRFAACLLDSFDVACHLFWMNAHPMPWTRHADPGIRALVPPRDSDRKLCADLIKMTAILLDAMVRELRDAMGPDTTVLLLTDHGVMPEIEAGSGRYDGLINRDFDLNRLFERIGLLARAPDGSIDWKRTTCFDRTPWATSFIRHVSINFEGEWPQGWVPRPSPQARVAKWREVQARLESIRTDQSFKDASGQPRSSLLWDMNMGEDDTHFTLYPSFPSETRVTLAEGVTVGVNELFPLRHVYAKHTRLDGKLGMLLLSHPGEQGDAYGRRGVPMGKGGGRSQHVAPLVLALFGVPLPELADDAADRAAGRAPARHETVAGADFLYWMLDVREAQEMAIRPRLRSWEESLGFFDPARPLGAARARQRAFVESLRYTFDSPASARDARDEDPDGGETGSPPGDFDDGR